ncbi:MAG: OmpA family protein [Cytophagaceae bacterium]
MIRQFYLFLILIFLLFENSFGQNLVLTKIDTSSYPAIKGEFYAIDSLGRQILNLTKDNVSIKEGEYERKIISVENPSYKGPEALSAVLTIDVSGSMENNEYMDIAKMAAKVFVSMLPLDLSECAITSFDNLNYIPSDFTRNANRLNQAIESLKPAGGTDYNAALLTPVTGAFDIVKNGIHKKVIIFLTDGYGVSNDAEILSKAKDMEVYCISVGMLAPDILKKLSEQTGGLYFENVTTKEQAIQIFSTILFKVQNMQPSKIVWESNPECVSIKNVMFKTLNQNLQYYNTIYHTPTKGLYYLQATPEKISFSDLRLNQTIYSDITLKATNKAITIKSYKSNNPLYKVETTLPLTIEPNSPVVLKVSYNCTVAKPSQATIELLTDACFPVMLYLNTGNNQFTQTNTLNVIQPNGKEVLYKGTDTTVSWSGVPPNTKVQIELSRDNGIHWEVLASNVTQQPYPWKVTGDTTHQALIKVSLAPTANALSRYNFDPSAIKHVYSSDQGRSQYSGYPPYVLSPDGKYAISASFRQYNLLSTHDNKIIKTIPNNDQFPVFNNDGSKIFLFYKGQNENNLPVEIYDGTTFEKIGDGPIISNLLYDWYTGVCLPVTDNEMSYYVCSNSSTHIVSVHDFTSGRIIQTITIASGETLKGYKNGLATVSFSGGAAVYDMSTGEKILTVYDVHPYLYDAYLSNDGKFLITRSWDYYGKNINTTVYEIDTKKKLYAVTSVGGFLFPTISVFDHYLICPKDNNELVIVHIPTGEVVYKSSYPGNRACFSQYGNYIYFIDYDNSKTNYCTSGLIPKGVTKQQGSDSSNAVFNIVSPILSSKEIAFGQVYVPVQKNISNINLIENKNGLSLTINKLELTGKDASFFHVIQSNQTTIPAWKQGCTSELAFQPKEARNYEAVLNVYTNIGIFTVRLKGQGIMSDSYVSSKTIDMGKINVGSKKDSTVNACIKNNSNVPVIIESCRFSPNSNKAFRLILDESNTIASMQSKNIRVEFKPITSGIHMAYIEVFLKGQKSPIIIPVTGYGQEGQNRKIIIITKNKNTLKPVYATVSVLDQANHLPQNITRSSTSNYYSYFSLSDRTYMIAATAKNYYPDSTIFSTSSNADSIILFLTPIPNQYVTVSGVVKNKATQEPIAGLVSLISNSIIVRSTNTNSDGYFEFQIHKDSIYRIKGEATKFINDEHLIKVNSDQENIQQDLLLEPIQIGRTIQLNKVYFERSKAVLLEESYTELDKLVTLMLQYPKMKIYLSGHTDNQGDIAKNIQLSNERVQVIKDYLISKGIAANRISGKGFGPSQPIASNDTEETRRLNRRVEFKITAL